MDEIISTDEFIKQEIDKRVNQIRNSCKDKGINIGETEELYLRMGIAHGVSIAGLALVNIDMSKLVKGE
jgi:hypothetical protein